MRTSLRSLLFLSPCIALAGTFFVHAQDTPIQTDGAQVEGNIRIEYAEVLRVEPVYLPAPQTDTHDAPPTEANAVPMQDDEGGHTLTYDVDYILRGVKYRSRIPYDPGNRLQVQLTVTPVLVPEGPDRDSPR